MAYDILLLLSRNNEQYYTLLHSQPLQQLVILRADDTASALTLAPQATILLGEPDRIAPLLGHVKRLKWVQSTYGGIDALLAPELRRDYQLTTTKGNFGPLISEYVFAHLLSLTRHLPLYREQQRQRRWHPLPYHSLAKRRMLILGTGSIGSCLAQTAIQFGMQVWGVNSTGHEVAGFTETYQASALPQILPQVDIIVVTLPATKETYHLLNKDNLPHCKPTAILFNVGRGSVIDTADLLESLKAGRPGAAILDVFEEEPLPTDHPLWKQPNVLITPHNAAWSEPRQVMRHFVLNLICYQHGEKLESLVDFDKGY